jgi:GT2 family glycosyltransferase
VRICVVCREGACSEGEGSRRWAWECCAALAGAGHEVHLLAAEGNTGGAPDGVTPHAVDLGGPAAIPGAYPTNGMRHAMGVYATLLGLHERSRLDLVIFSLRDGEGYFALRGKRMLGQFAGAVMAVWASTPSVDLRTANMDSRFDGEAVFADHMELACLREADLLLAATGAVLDLVRERIESDPAWPLPRRAVVGLGRTPRKNDAATPPAAGPATVVVPGPLEWRRGIADFAVAAHRLSAQRPGVRFRLVGEDTDTAPIGRSARALLASRYGVGEDGPVAFGDATPTVVCIPGAGIEPEWAMIDALAAGVPVAAAATEAMRGAFDVPGAFWAAPGDADSLADAIARALDAGSPGPASFDPAAFAGRIIAAAEQARTEEGDTPSAAVSGGIADLSVIVPVYNLGAYVRRTLASIDSQTLRPREVIIVDDGSPDEETARVLAELEAEGRRVIRKANGGVGSARNAGLRAASGRWVCFIDADDLLHPTYFEKLVGVLERNDRLTYASALVRCFEGDNPAEATAGWVPLGMAGFDRDLVLHMNVGGIAGSVFDRRAVLEVGGYDEVTPSYEDWDLWCKLARAGVRGAVVPEFLFYYRVREGSKYRTQGLTRHLHLKSYIIARHADALASSRTLRLQLGEAEAAAREARHLRERLEAAEAAAREAQASRDDLAVRTAAAETSVGEAWANAGKLEEHLKHANALLAAAEARAQDAAGRAAAAEARARQQAEESARRIGELELRLASALREQERLAERLAQATEQTLTTADALARARQELAAAESTIADLRRQIETHDCWVHTRHVLEENVRYRLADRVNAVIKGSRIHSAVKSIARHAAGRNGTR